MSKDIDEIKAALRRKRTEPKPKGYLGSGATMVNLASAGRAKGAMQTGGYALVIGDSTSGKTVFAGTILAEAAINPFFDEYDLIFDNVENGAMFFEKFFGSRIAARIKAPRYDKDGIARYSRTVEEFYLNAYNATRCKDGTRKKCVYILDSEPALSSEAEQDKQAEKRKSIEEDKEVAGTMTDAKAKIHSQNIRAFNTDLIQTDSIAIILTQTRDNMGFGAKFNPKTRPGGRALKFYAQLEWWMSVRASIEKMVMGKKRKIGIISEIRVKKNRFTGKERTVFVPIYTSFGIDDLGSMISFLIEEGHWTENKNVIDAVELKFKGKLDKLIEHIEANNLESNLRTVAKKLWFEIEAQCEVTRKSRYV